MPRPYPLRDDAEGKSNLNITVAFLAASFLLILLVSIILLIPRFLHKKEESPSGNQETNLFIDSLQQLGGEIRLLKEQLSTKERLAALGEVSAGIAHEFRNPMGVIAGYARLLLKSLDEADKRRDIVQGILNEVEGMNRVMEELVKFSRLEPVNRAALDLEKVITGIIDAMGTTGKTIHVSFRDMVSFKGDETLIKQAIRNLLQNALEAGSEAWIEVQRGSHSGKEGMFVSVRDNGKGIPKEALMRIFSPFYTTKSDGLGIGLPLVQKIAMAHGGTVEASSEEGKGSVFRLFLPSA